MTKTRPRGWWYPYIFVAMFGVVIAVNGALLFFATTTFAGLETKGAYDKGLRYNDTLAAAEAQAALGWRVEAEAVPLPERAAGEGRAADIAVTIADPSGAPVTGLAVRVKLSRPTVQGYDRELALVETAAGRYGASVELPLRGQWSMQVVAARGQDLHQTSRRIVLP